MTDQELYTVVRDAMSNCKPVERVSYKLREAAQATGLSESFLRTEIKAGRLVAAKLSNTVTVVEVDALKRFLAERRTRQEKPCQYSNEEMSTGTPLPSAGDEFSRPRGSQVSA